MNCPQATAETREFDVGPVLGFLHLRTPVAWIDQAVADPDTLLLDHAALELKAAGQAQKLIWKYGAVAAPPGSGLDARGRGRLVQKLSRLAREELKHFEQVTALIERRGGSFVALPASRYAAGLHALARRDEPGALIDALLIGAVIEARSCERFLSLVEPLAGIDLGLANFYASLLRAEARHFADYLALAASVPGSDHADRVEVLLRRDAELMLAGDGELRFHSGPPAVIRPR
jgi:tRNA-(ms[2]io[6]A)-hydroxylase